ncbi:RDD family protein [Vibrio sp. SCSIO 43137]|uniref:RDD family protein n=1 Tax=Vibrio sp. SCSIO 43137 TaxID=3021011 RepID=UPI0023074ED0|nr:RDD family protein [Vibrio sp. SCSIO 43137]WCE31525.1 RDD family protein [Vibrio sp. SCSIO 43137]
MSEIIAAEIRPDADIMKEAKLASRWSRLGAAVVDGIIMIIVFGGLFWISPPEVMQSLSNSEFQFAFWIVINCVFLVVQGYLLHTRGQTIGKNMFDIAIVSVKTNQKLGIVSLYLKRYVVLGILSFIPFLNIVASLDVFFIFRKDKRCLHDLIAGTKVIDISKPEIEFDPSNYD